MADIPAGWPCARLSASPPSVIDRQALPTADDLLPQILALTPRGAAWGTDEAGDGSGASPVQRSFWRGIAAWVADHLGRDFEASSQTFPSALTYTLGDWETELGLPSACMSGQGGQDARIAAVRARFGAVGGASPAYLTCLAQAAGYDITINEPTQFLCDVSECIGGDPEETWFFADGNNTDGIYSYDIVETYALCDDAGCDETPVEDFTLPAAGDGNVLDSFDVVETYAFCDDAICDDDLVEGFTLPALGDGDPLEAIVLAPDTDGVGDESAGGWIETYAACDDAACDDTLTEGIDTDPNGTVWKFWVVHVESQGETAFQVDTGECGFDPIEGYVPATDLECLLRAICPPSTQLVFDYAAAA